MNSDIYVAIISGSVTILVGIITAVSAYRGAIKGVKTQIQHEQELIEKNKKEQKWFINRAVEQFIMDEVKYNFSLFSGECIRLVNLYDTPVQYAHNLYGKFKFEEFNRFKGDLIKHENDFAKELIDFYSVFYKVNYTRDLLELSQNEYAEVKKALKRLDKLI